MIRSVKSELEKYKMDWLVETQERQRDRLELLSDKWQSSIQLWTKTLTKTSLVFILD